MSEKEIIFCKSGGCTAKLGAGVLEHILERLPKGQKDENLLVGYDSSDDAAVYKLNDHQAFVQTLDFFPPMVEDPYLFGQIAATNALSDIYAMGGDVKTALNIVCFPESMDLNILGKILQGGAEKVQEAGGSLAGGHSIADSDVKYGLSVTGIVDPEKIWKNNGAKSGDKLILTKRLGVGIICAANRVKQAPEGAMEQVIASMTTLNRTAFEIWNKAKGESYEPKVFSNGDTLRQLLARSRYLLFKAPDKWLQSQKVRAKLLFEQFPDIKSVYYYALRLGKIFSDYTDKDVARAKLALWYNEIEEFGYDTFTTVANSIENHYERILNYFVNRSTNAAAEAFNAKIKAFRASFRGVVDKRFFLYRLAKVYA